MDKKPNKRARIQIAILCVIVSVFVITGIIYAITIKQYVLGDDNLPDGNYYASSETQPETVPETEPATPAPVVTEEPVPTKTPELSFRQQNEENMLTRSKHRIRHICLIQPMLQLQRLL